MAPRTRAHVRARVSLRFSRAASHRALQQQMQVLQGRMQELMDEQTRLRQTINDRKTANILLVMSAMPNQRGPGSAPPPREDASGVSNLLELASCRSSAPAAGGADADAAASSSAAEATGAGPDACGDESMSSGADGGAQAPGFAKEEDTEMDDLADDLADGAPTSAVTATADDHDDDDDDSDLHSDDDAAGAAGADGTGEAFNMALLSKERAQCTQQELNQIRRERNRMHAKRTRVRKKVQMEEIQETINKVR